MGPKGLLSVLGIVGSLMILISSITNEDERWRKQYIAWQNDTNRLPLFSVIRYEIDPELGQDKHPYIIDLVGSQSNIGSIANSNFLIEVVNGGEMGMLVCLRFQTDLGLDTCLPITIVELAKLLETLPAQNNENLLPGYMHIPALGIKFSDSASYDVKDLLFTESDDDPGLFKFVIFFKDGRIYASTIESRNNIGFISTEQSLSSAMNIPNITRADVSGGYLLVPEEMDPESVEFKALVAQLNSANEVTSSFIKYLNGEGLSEFKQELDLK